MDTTQTTTRPNTYRIYEEGYCFTQLIGATAEAALRKAVREARYSASDYNGAPGDEVELTWYAFNDDDESDRGGMTFTAVLR